MAETGFPKKDVRTGHTRNRTRTGGRLLWGLTILLMTFLTWSCSSMTASQAWTGSKQISPKDGMWMVFVPHGNFRMGSDNDTDYEKPMHTVWLDSFWIDRTEVTNVQFEKFVDESNYQTDAEQAGWSYVYDMASTRWVKESGVNWRHPRGPAITPAHLCPLQTRGVSPACAESRAYRADACNRPRLTNLRPWFIVLILPFYFPQVQYDANDIIRKQDQ